MQSASDRIKWFRLAINYSQPEMADLLGIDFIRYKNIEQRKARVSELEFEPLCRQFKGLVHFFTYGGELDLEALRVSDEPLERLLVAAIESNKKLEALPEGVLKI